MARTLALAPVTGVALACLLVGPLGRTTAGAAPAASHPSATRSGRPALLAFSIRGCAPCRQLAPTIDRLKRDGFDVRRVDGRQRPQAAARFGVESYPTLILVADGQSVARWRGVQSYATLRAALESADHPRQAGVDEGGAPPVTIPGNAPSGPTGPAEGRTPHGGSARLLRSAVRLRVRDAGGSSYGTGTVIDSRQGEALVLTCGHLFRDLPGSPEVTAELFRASPSGIEVAERVTGQVLSFDLENDVALVAIRPRTAPGVAPVARTVTPVAINEAVWSVGCDRGAAPTVRSGRVTTTDKYLSPASVTVTGAPVVGRSGGGLFNERGELVGVCYGAHGKSDQGFYAKLSSVYAELDKLGLQEIYRGVPGTPAAGMTLATTGTGARPQPPNRAVPAGSAPAPPGLRRVSPPAWPDVLRGQNTPPATGRPPATAEASAARLARGLPAAEQAALQEIARRASEAEVVCVIRPKVPGGKSEVITLDRVSPELLRALMALRPGPADPASRR